MFRVTLVVLTLVAVSYAAVALMKPDPKPEKFKAIEGCYLKELDQMVPFGKRVPSIKYCQEYACGSEYVQVFSCGAVGTSPPCWVTETYSNVLEKPYPSCCPTIECPDDN